jgi:vesicle coat complex subunit
MLSHPWLKMKPMYETKMNDEELSDYLARQQQLAEIMDPPMLGEEMSKLDETDTEINCGDRETNGLTQLQEIDEVLANESSDEEEDESTEANSNNNPKELRDIAEGKNLNNSFIGSSYPENWDHLHFDKGSNP